MDPTPKNTAQLEDQALLIANEIFNLINEYTNDSHVSKFFLTDEIASACYGLTAGFTSVIYTPSLNPEQTVDSAMLSFLYALMTYGFNIYLKERSLKTNSQPYRIAFWQTGSKESSKNYVEYEQQKAILYQHLLQITSLPLLLKISLPR